MVHTMEQKGKKPAFSLGRLKNRKHFGTRSINRDEMSPTLVSIKKIKKNVQRSRRISGTVAIAESSIAARKSWQRFAAKYIGTTIFVKESK